MADKKVSIYGGYRNNVWYETILKDATADEAYATILENLKHPTFLHEKDCALDVYTKKYGKFQSKEQQVIESQAEEIARLRKQVEAASTVIVNTLQEEPEKPADKSTEIISPENFPKNMDKESFKSLYAVWYEKSQGIKPHWQIWGKAWRKYQGDQESEVPGNVPA